MRLEVCGRAAFFGPLGDEGIEFLKGVNQSRSTIGRALKGAAA